MVKVKVDKTFNNNNNNNNRITIILIMPKKIILIKPRVNKIFTCEISQIADAIWHFFVC
jgi:hypothetical protein